MLTSSPRTAKGKGDPIEHQVLNARYHEQEASIVAQAGVPGAVTIATNMAGRGTDIQLGGNAEYRLRDWIAGGDAPKGATARRGRDQGTSASNSSPTLPPRSRRRSKPAAST